MRRPAASLIGFCLLTNLSHAQQQNILNNGGFESRPVPIKFLKKTGGTLDRLGWVIRNTNLNLRRIPP